MIPQVAWRIAITIFFLSFFLPCRIFAQHDPFVIVMKDKSSGLPLGGASLVSLNSRFAQTSDSAGRMAIPYQVYQKGERLLITMIGYKPISLQARNLARLQDIIMAYDTLTLREVVVTNNNPIAKVRALQMGSELISASEARKLPAILGEVDIIKILQLKPGVKSAGEGLAGFYVRGGGADQNLILVDNAPVYNPNHLLGLFSVFNNDALREVKLYKAAYPAEYSGRLSSVLDVSMRPGSMDTFSVSGGLGFLSSRLTLESPIQRGRSSLIISGRRTYFDVLTNALNSAKKGDSAYEPIPPYYFSDLNLRTDWKINNRNALWATGYLGSDNFRSAEEESSSSFIWGNRTASLNWRSVVSPEMEITSTLFYSGYRYELSNRFNLNTIVLQSGINSVGVKVVARSVKEKQLKLQAGFDGVLHMLKIGDFKASSDLSGFVAGEKKSGNEGGLFVNSEWDPGKNFALLAGMRLSGFYTGNKFHFNAEPRLGARVNISENAAIKGSYTRMYQYLHLASLSSASLPTDIWYPSTEKTRPQYADQVSLGWSKAVKDNSIFLSLESYYKWMNNQVEFRDGADVFGNPRLENDFVYGKANAYGLEAYLEKKLGRTTGWLGYTLSWTTRTFAAINEGLPFKPRFDRRHDFSFVISHKLSNKFTLSGNWIFGTGAYITVPVGRFVFQDQIGDRIRTITPIYNKRSNFQLPPVHRLDLSLVMALKSKSGETDLTFSLYNAYSRRNPFYIRFREVDNNDGILTAIEPTLVSLFPVLPGITYNFKF